MSYWYDDIMLDQFRFHRFWPYFLCLIMYGSTIHTNVHAGHILHFNHLSITSKNIHSMITMSHRRWFVTIDHFAFDRFQHFLNLCHIRHELHTWLCSSTLRGIDQTVHQCCYNHIYDVNNVARSRNCDNWSISHLSVFMLLRRLHQTMDAIIINFDIHLTYAICLRHQMLWRLHIQSQKQCLGPLTWFFWNFTFRVFRL